MYRLLSNPVYLSNKNIDTKTRFLIVMQEANQTFLKLLPSQAGMESSIRLLSLVFKNGLVLFNFRFGTEFVELFLVTCFLLFDPVFDLLGLSLTATPFSKSIGLSTVKNTS